MRLPTPSVFLSAKEMPSDKTDKLSQNGMKNCQWYIFYLFLQGLT